MPYSAQHSATIRQAWPATSTSGLRLVGRELRGALRHQRALLPLVHVALLDHVDDDLTVGTERVGKLTAVGDRHGGLAIAVADAEIRRVPLLVIAGDLLADQLVLLARSWRGGRQFRGLTRLSRGGKARIGERAGQQDGGRERHYEADRALARRGHPTIMAPAGRRWR